MSYILDALKRADAERSNAVSGATPSDPQTFAPATSAHGRHLSKSLLLGAMSLVLLAAVATWWMRKGRAPDQPVMAPETTVAASPVLPPAPVAVPPSGAETRDQTPALPPSSQATKPFVGPTQTPAAVLRPPPMPGNAPDRAQNPTLTPAQAAARGAAPMPIQGRPVAPQESSAVVPPADTASDSTGTMAPGAPAAPGAGVPAAPPPAPPIPAPPAVTRITSAPSAGGPSGTLASDAGLKVTGATYSENPAHRLLIVNGKVVKEGQEVEPGLVLEVIAPRSAVFKRQGTRFNVNY